MADVNIGPRKANRRVRHQGHSEESDLRNCHRSRPVPSTGSSQGLHSELTQIEGKTGTISASGILRTVQRTESVDARPEGG